MIKRPLLWILGAYILGILLAWYRAHQFLLFFIILIYCIILISLVFDIKELINGKKTPAGHNGVTTQQTRSYRGIIKRGLSSYRGNIKDNFLWVLPFLLLLGFYGMKTGMSPAPADHSFEETVPCTVTGEITMVVDKSWGRALYVRNNRLDISGFDPFLVENIIVYCSDEQNYRIGNKITVSGTLNKFSKPSNPGQFNELMYYKMQNISYKVKAEEIIIVDSNYSKLYHYLTQIKERFLKVYETILPKREAGAIVAMLLGEKNLLDQEINELYQENGISHILAISGLHISLIGAAVYSLLRKCKTRLILSTISSILIVYCYGILTNFSISTNRAVVMFIIMLMAKIFGKTYDMLSALSLCALIILLQNPLQIFHAGFLLSFGAVFGLAVLLPCFQSLISVKNPLLDAVLVSISAQIMTLPLILVFFYQLPVYSVFINLLIIPSSSALILSALVAGILGLFSLPIGIFFIGGTNYILKLYEYFCRLGSNIPGNLYTVGSPDALRIMAYLLLLILFLWGSYRYKKKWWLLLPVLAVVVLIVPRGREGLTITMLEVGQGEAIVIENETGTTYLIDGGSADTSRVGQNRIQPFLLYNGIDRIDYAVVSHCDLDHISGLVELIEKSASGQRIRIRNLVLPYIHIDDEVRMKYIESIRTEEETKVTYTNQEKAVLSYLELETIARKHEIPIYYLKAGDQIKDGELILRCLHPKEDFAYSSSNSYSTVLSASYGDFDMLLTGDLEREGEKGFIVDLEDYDVLKVAHHGSKNSTSEELLSIIRPEISLISCSKNNRYGHPHEELMERLKGMESNIKITYECGAIIIKTDGKKMYVTQVCDTGTG